MNKKSLSILGLDMLVLGAIWFFSLTTLTQPC